MNRKQKRMGISFSMFLLFAMVGLILRTFNEKGRIFPLMMPFQNPGPIVKEIVRDNVQIPDSILNPEFIKRMLPQGDGDETEVGLDFDGPQYEITDRLCFGEMFDWRTYVNLDEVESRLMFMTKELRKNLPVKDAPEGVYCMGENDSKIWVGLNQKDLLELKKDGTIERHQYISPQPE
jgi:hypothetical protein